MTWGRTEMTWGHPKMTLGRPEITSGDPEMTRDCFKDSPFFIWAKKSACFILLSDSETGADGFNVWGLVETSGVAQVLELVLACKAQVCFTEGVEAVGN